MIRIARMCCSLFLVLFLTGCWNRIELNEIGITSATGYDRSGDNWVATYQVIVPSSITSNTGGGSGSSQPAVNVFSVTANTITEAANLSNLENPRSLYFSHNNVIVIGKEAMKKGINQLIDQYFRSSDKRESVWVLITDKTASEILRKLIPPEKIPGASLSEILRKEKKSSSIFTPVTVFDYAYKMNSDAKAIGIPIITTSGDINSKNNKKLESLDSFKDVAQSHNVRLTGLAVIKDDQWIGQMNLRESRGLSWMTNNVKSTVLSLPSSEKENKQRISLTIFASKTKLRPVKKGYHYMMNVNVKAKAELSESGSDLNLSNEANVKQVEAQASKLITEEINVSWNAIRKMEADLGGFADLIHREYPKDWNDIKEDWNSELKKIELNVQVEVVIKRPGMFQNSFQNLE